MGVHGELPGTIGVWKRKIGCFYSLGLIFHEKAPTQIK